jgi:hypothetical protein
MVFTFIGQEGVFPANLGGLSRLGLILWGSKKNGP